MIRIDCSRVVKRCIRTIVDRKRCRVYANTANTKYMSEHDTHITSLSIDCNCKRYLVRAITRQDYIGQ